MTKKTTPSLEDYVDKLIAEKQYPALEKEALSKMKQDLLKKLKNLLNLKLLAKLPEAELSHAYHLIQESTEKNAEELARLIDEKVIDKEKIIAESLLNFRKLYLGLT